jgi:hypothetical protein
MPTIARFMNIALPQSAAREVDGVPLTGRLSLSNPSLTIENNKAVVQWKALDKEGSVKLWLAGTNNFKTGGNDNYSLLKTVPLSTQKVVLPLSSLPAGFYKLVLEGPHNQVNIWMPEAKKANP